MREKENSISKEAIIALVVVAGVVVYLLNNSASFSNAQGGRSIHGVSSRNAQFQAGVYGAPISNQAIYRWGQVNDYRYGVAPKLQQAGTPQAVYDVGPVQERAGEDTNAPILENAVVKIVPRRNGLTSLTLTTNVSDDFDASQVAAYITWYNDDKQYMLQPMHPIRISGVYQAVTVLPFGRKKRARITLIDSAGNQSDYMTDDFPQVRETINIGFTEM